MGNHRRNPDFSRIPLAFFGGGVTGTTALSVLYAHGQDAYLRWLFKTRRVIVDFGRTKKRYLHHYPDPPLQQRQTRDAALKMGFDREHVIYEPFDAARVERVLVDAEIQAAVVVSYGAAIPRRILELLNYNVFVLHPTAPLPVRAKRIPKLFRGASVIERLVSNSTSQGMLQIAMLRAEEVTDPTDPTAWDAGEVVGRSVPFPMPFFTPEELAPGEEALSARVRRMQEWISSMYADPLQQLPRILGMRPHDLIEAGVPRNRVENTFGFKPHELAASSLLDDQRVKRLRKRWRNDDKRRRRMLRANGSVPV